MPEEYQRISKIIVWIVSLSMVAYFVLTPLTLLRPTPPQTAPQPEEVVPATEPVTEPAAVDTNQIDIFGAETETGSGTSSDLEPTQ